MVIDIEVMKKRKENSANFWLFVRGDTIILVVVFLCKLERYYSLVIIPKDFHRCSYFIPTMYMIPFLDVFVVV